ncbi:hypothetical protein [Segetibacter koreensis]|uniref:hypothetical protein n=1 Tax=Segetibacter koreensis TaxID=398037 RepID=UPI0003A4BA52|nr:hypothetical protein [Segetibacter koreensis]
MKKRLISLFLLVVLTLISIYLFIPTRLEISTVTVMKANTNALFRYLSDENKWEKWWPVDREEESINANAPPRLNNYTYRVSKKLYNAVEIETIQKNQLVPGKIIILPITEDSLIVQWKSSITTSLNPFTRIEEYRDAVNVKKNMTVILNHLQSFIEDNERVYKFHIRHTTLKDTALVAIKVLTTSYPSIPFIYQHIKELRTYISSQKAREVDYPRLNITKKDSSHYEVMVAIPTNIPLPGEGNISFKRLLIYKDKTLTADVTGGPENIKKAFDELSTYMSDYNLSSPVIPWETLITDRSKETDSTKWITKIFILIA